MNRNAHLRSRRTALGVALCFCLHVVARRSAVAAFSMIRPSCSGLLHQSHRRRHGVVNNNNNPTADDHQRPRGRVLVRGWGDAISTTVARRCNYEYGICAHPSFAGRSSTALGATKRSSSTAAGKKNKKKSSTSASLTGGFGGAAVQACSCGSNLPYNKCCGRIHRDLKAYTDARPSDVVKARYTAYAKRVVDFIVASTHPDNPSISNGDIEHWKRTIEANCYDNFLLNSCVILEEKVEEHYQDDDQSKEEKATVKFEAKMTHRETGERTAFVETSTFLRDPTTGAWLYRDGIISSPEDDEDDVDDLEANATAS